MPAELLINASPLKGDALLYRAMRNAVWQDEPALAFMLRSREKDSRGLSVLLRADCGENRCALAAIFDNYSSCYGEIVLEVRDVLALPEVRIVPDEAHPGHANIVGLPYPDDGNEARDAANTIADILASKVKHINLNRYKRPKVKPPA